MITIRHKIHFQNGQRTRKQLRQGDASPEPSVGRVPRVSRLMALAIHLEGLIRNGLITDQAELARLGHVSRARLTQIMNLLCLAPDIQEQILFLPATERGRDAMTEKDVRPIAALAEWKKQRRIWNQRATSVQHHSIEIPHPYVRAKMDKLLIIKPF